MSTVNAREPLVEEYEATLRVLDHLGQDPSLGNEVQGIRKRTHLLLAERKRACMLAIARLREFLITEPTPSEVCKAVGSTVLAFPDLISEDHVPRPTHQNVFRSRSGIPSWEVVISTEGEGHTVWYEEDGAHITFICHV